MRQSGYIALTAAIIITILILSIVATVSSTGYFARFNVLETLLKTESNELSSACADYALLELALDVNYTGSTTVNVASTTCRIYPVITDGTQKTIQTEGTRDNTITNTEVILHSGNFTILSWKEVESL